MGPTTFVNLLLAASAIAMMPGGISDNERPVTAELKTKLDTIKRNLEVEVEDASNGPVYRLKPITYKSQVVAGINYFVKYQLNDSQVYYHAKIFQDLHGKETLEGIRGPKTESDPIVYF